MYKGHIHLNLEVDVYTFVFIDLQKQIAVANEIASTIGEIRVHIKNVHIHYTCIVIPCQNMIGRDP